MAETRAQSNRRIRQEALREQLEAQGHVQHVTDILEKMSNPDEHIEQDMVSRYRVVLDNKLKLINKYLPDLKSTELTGDPDNPISHDHIVEFIGVADRDS